MPAFTCQLLPLILWTVIVSAVMPYASAQDESELVRQSTRTRRVLYNFDGDSCLSTKAGSKGPVPVNIDDVKRLIEEVAYEGSRVDTVLVCINAQVMYYPTKVDVGLFVGSFGLFLTLMLLFCRFLPTISVAEVKAVAPGAQPSHGGGHG